MILFKRKVYFVSLLLLPNILFAKEKKSILQLGLHISMGTHVKRIGFSTTFYHIDNHLQISLRSLLNYSFKSFGPAKKRLEWQLTEGCHYFFTEKETAYGNTIFNELSNLSNYKNGIGYTLKQYVDKSGTSQHSAMISLRVNNTVISSENDLFLFDFLDKYRSGALLIRYEASNQPIAIQYKLQIYTGNSLCRTCSTSYDSTTKRYYISIPANEGGTFSHGVSSLEFETLVKHSIPTRLSIGMDNEKIRNLVQNFIIHDQLFLPKKWRQPNAHIPMLNADGSSHLEDGKPLRKSRPYIQLGVYEPIFW